MGRKVLPSTPSPSTSPNLHLFLLLYILQLTLSNFVHPPSQVLSEFPFPKLCQFLMCSEGSQYRSSSSIDILHYMCLCDRISILSTTSRNPISNLHLVWCYISNTQCYTVYVLRAVYLYNLNNYCRRIRLSGRGFDFNAVGMFAALLYVAQRAGQ